MKEPPGDGGALAAAVEELPGAAELLSLFVLAAICLAILVALLRKGFLDYRARHGPAEPPLWGVREILTVVGVYFLVSVFSGILLAGVLHERGPLDRFGRAVGFLAMLVLSWGPTLGLVLYFIRRDLGQPISTLGFRPAPWRSFAACVSLYLLLLAPLGCVAIAWYLLLREAGADIREQDVLTMFRGAASEGDLLSFAVLAAMAVIVAPVCEETLFRGFIFGALRERWGTALAAVVSSALFAAVHFSLGAFALILSLGLVLCGVYVRTGSLYPAVFLHTLFNGVTLTKAIYDGVNAGP